MTISSCPFCGAIQVGCLELAERQWAVRCERCGAQGSSMKSQQSAVDVWEGVAQKIGLTADDIGFLR